MDMNREVMIANLSWWSGWCTDEGHNELGAFLLDVKDQLRKDRPTETEKP